MTPLALTDQQLKTVLDVAGFVPRRLRRKFLKDIAAQLPVVPGTKKIPERSHGHRRGASHRRRAREARRRPSQVIARCKKLNGIHVRHENRWCR